MFSSLKESIKAIGPVYRAVNRAKGLRIHEPGRSGFSYEVLGSSYGGWAVILDALHPDSIVYSVGVGEDISFDLALIDRVGCAVHAFDPTPIAVDWIARQALPSRLLFHPVGLGALDEEVEFQIPPIQGWHSYSLTAEPNAAQRGTVSCPIRKLTTLMSDFGHLHLDLLKMDIEGFEYPVIDDLALSQVRPSQLLVEFHHLLYTHTHQQTRDAVAKVLALGYDLFWVSDLGREYGFRKRDNDQVTRLA
jgi:FkbM family methyltransferase